jgi:chromosome segregation ATPase
MAEGYDPPSALIGHAPTERELVDLTRAQGNLISARAAREWMRDTQGVLGDTHPIAYALDTLEALIAEAHESRRAVLKLSQHRDVAELLSTGPDVTELVDTVIDAAGRMMATVLELADAPRIRALEAQIENLNLSRGELSRRINDLIAERDAARRDRANFAESAQAHIDELRDEIKTRAHVEAQRVEEIAALRRELDEA